MGRLVLDQEFLWADWIGRQMGYGNGKLDGMRMNEQQTPGQMATAAAAFIYIHDGQQ